MTVGIGAISDSGQTLVLATDQQVTIGDFTADLPGMIKGSFLHNTWTVLFAGDMSYVSPLLERIADGLEQMPLPTAEQMTQVLTSAFHAERRRVIEDKVLSSYGLTIEKFLAAGVKTFGEVGFSQIQAAIEKVRLDCELLVCGFDGRKVPHILYLEDPGLVRDHTRVGFWAIGSGGPAAISSLFFNKYSIGSSTIRAIYRVGEAKFMAEAALGVGENTLMAILHDTGQRIDLFPQQTDYLRSIWEAEGRPRYPENLKPRIDKMIKARIAELTQAREAKPFDRKDGDSDVDDIKGPKVE